MMQDNMADRYSPGWGTRAVMAGGGILSALALIGIISVLPDIAADLAHGPQDGMLVKQLVGIVSLAMVLGSPLAGFLVDRLGLRRVLVIAALIYAIAGTAGLYLDGLKSLVASRFFVGMSAATIQIISFTLINTRLNTQQRARWMGIHVSFAMIGTIIIHPLAGVLGETSWRRPFWLYSIGILVALAALLDRSLDAPPLIAKPTLAGGEPVNQKFLSWFPFRFMPLAFCVGAIAFLPMVHLPFLLRQRGLESTSLISLVLTADSVVGAGMAILYGRARQSYSANAAFGFSFAMTGLGTLIAALSPNSFGVIAGMLIFGFGIGWLVPNLMTAVAAKVTQPRQGRTAGLIKAAHFIATPICIPLMEPFAQKYGSQSAMFVAAALALTMLCIMLYRIKATRSASDGTTATAV
jgi:MFS family permease